MPAWRTRTTNAATCGRSTAVRHTFAPGCPAEYGRRMTPSTSGDGSGKRYPQKHRGPVTLRRAQVQHSTTDQRLLDSAGTRSEEHTSELQSRGHLVCRLL